MVLPQDPQNSRTSDGCIPPSIPRRSVIRDLANVLSDDCMECWEPLYRRDLDMDDSELETQNKVVGDLIKHFVRLETSGDRPNDLDLVYCAYKLNDPHALEEWRSKQSVWFRTLGSNAGKTDTSIPDQDVRTIVEKVWSWMEPEIMDQDTMRDFLVQNPNVFAQLNGSPSDTELCSAQFTASLWLKSSLYHKKAVLSDKISQLLSRYVDDIQTFVGKGDLPRWKPFESACLPIDLDIPAYPGINAPCLLLHGIKEDNTNVEHIFDASSSTLLVNASGCGKSRLAILGLVLYWGFYMTCTYETGLAGTPTVGSEDLSHALSNIIPNHPAFTSPSTMKKLDKTQRDIRLRHNHTIAERHCRVVMLARLLMFRAFLQACHKDAERSSQSFKDRESLYRYRWLLLQLYPCLLKGDVPDIFLDLTRSLSHIYPDDVYNLAQQEFLRIRQMTGSQNLYCVVDEAQFAGREFLGSFASRRSGYAEAIYRPILSPMFSGWERLGIRNILYVVTGTGINKGVMIEALNSSSHKQGSLRVCHRTGGFDDPSKQWNYVKQFLPTDYQQSALGKALRWRMWWWLRGRYRYTTAYIEALLLDGYNHAHHLLDEYVRYSGFVSPSEGELCLMKERKLHGPRRAFVFRHIVPDYGRLFKYKELCNRLENIFYKIFLRSQNGTNKNAIHMLTSRQVDFINHGITGVQKDWPQPVSPFDEAELIRYGIARVQGEHDPERDSHRDESLDNVTINEPITLGLAMNSLRATKGRVLSWTFEMENQTGDTEGMCNGFENLVGVYLATKFATWCRLSSIFDFVDVGEDRLKPLETAYARLIARHPDSMYFFQPQSSQNDGPPHAHVSYSDTFMTMENPGGAWNYQPSLQNSRKRLRAVQEEDRYCCGPTVELGFCGGNDMEMFDIWMRGETGIPICFPPRDAGPDLLLCLELKSDNASFDGKCIWVAIQAKRHKQFYPSNFLRGLRTVSPSGMYMYEPEAEKQNRKRTNVDNSTLVDDDGLAPQRTSQAPLSAGTGSDPLSRQLKGQRKDGMGHIKGQPKNTKQVVDILSRYKDRAVTVSDKECIGRDYMCDRFSKLRNALSLRSLEIPEAEHDFTVLRVLAIAPAEVPRLAQHHKADSLITKDKHPIVTLKASELYASDEKRITTTRPHKRLKTDHEFRPSPCQVFRMALEAEDHINGDGSDMDE